MNNEFKWDDEKVIEFTTWSLNNSPAFQGRYADIEQFKKSKQPPVKEQPSFQILSFTDNKELIILREDGKYEYEVSIICHGYTLHEILEVGRSVKSGQIKIHSVKRNSDGEVFKCGQKFLADAGCELTIKSFEIVDNKVKVWSEEYGFWYLHKIRHINDSVKPILTEDGFQVTDVNETLYTARKHDNSKYVESSEILVKDFINSKCFLKKENRDRWVEQNTPKQPVFTCNGVDYFHGDHYFRVLKDFSLRENVALEVPDEDHLDCAVFPTKQMAEDCILMNKRIFISLDDLHNYSMDTMCYSKFFIEFFRSKTLG